MGKRILALLALAVLAVACGDSEPRPATFGAINDDDCANHSFETLKVTAQPHRARYRVGDIAKIAVTIERSLEELDQDYSTADLNAGPVEGAKVGLGLSLGDAYLAGASLTDETGQAVVQIKIQKPAPTGWADVRGTAWKDLVSDPCPVTETGWIQADRMFRVIAAR